jgi:spoIIIJ-associated protein
VDGVEAEGRTVNEATEKALEELGLTRAEVDVEVLSEGRPRILGFGGEPARVRVTPRPVVPVMESRAAEARMPLAADEDEDEEYDDEDFEDDDEEYDEDEEGEEGDEDEFEEEELPPELQRPAPRPVTAAVTPVAVEPEDVEAAVKVLENLLQLMGLDATVTAREPETAGDGLGMIQAVLDVDGEDLGLLIGRRGQTLTSLQYVLNLMVSKQVHKRVAFGIDVDGYRRRREEALVTLAMRTASRVRGSGRSVTLEPMPANERRIVHLALADDPNVMTVSIGEGEERKVAITPAH